MFISNKKVAEVSRINNFGYIDWMLGNTCNYKCSYCFDGASDGTYRPPEFNDILIENIKHLQNTISENSTIDTFWHFAGGEPTLYKDLKTIVKFIKSFNKTYVSMTSNGSRTERWWKENINLFDTLSLSYHTEFSNLDHFKKIINYSNSFITINVMIGSPNYEQAIIAFKDFSKHILDNKLDNIYLKFLILRDPFRKKYTFVDLNTEQKQNVISIQEDYDFKHEQLSSTRTVSSKLIDRSAVFYVEGETAPIVLEKKHEFAFQGSWKGYQCFAPRDLIQIHEDGSLGRLSCGQKLTVTNIFEHDFIKKFVHYKDGITCNIGTCGCLGLLEATKKLQFNLNDTNI